MIRKGHPHGKIYDRYGRTEGKLSRRNGHTLGGDIQMKRVTYEETCTQRRHTHGEEVRTEDNIHEGDIHVPVERTYKWRDIYTEGDLHKGI